MKTKHRTMSGALRGVKRVLRGREYSFAPGGGAPNGVVPGEWAWIDAGEILIGRGDGRPHTVLGSVDEANDWITGRK